MIPTLFFSCSDVFTVASLIYLLSHCSCTCCAEKCVSVFLEQSSTAKLSKGKQMFVFFFFGRPSVCQFHFIFTVVQLKRFKDLASAQLKWSRCCKLRFKISDFAWRQHDTSPDETRRTRSLQCPTGVKSVALQWRISFMSSPVFHHILTSLFFLFHSDLKLSHLCSVFTLLLFNWDDFVSVWIIYDLIFNSVGQMWTKWKC